MAELSTQPQTASEVDAADLPEIPEYITYGFIKEYIDACSEAAQQRMTQILTNAGLLETFNEFVENEPDTVARSIIVDMFMAAI